MAPPLKIDFVSDIACPWCAVGLSALRLALSRVDEAVDTPIAVHPFELNPNMGPEGESLIEHLGKKYNRTPQQIAETQAMIRERGASVGFAFGTRTHIYNTFDAHRLLYWAGLEGKQLPLKVALLEAYHSNGKNPSNHDDLVEAAQTAGLDAARAREVLRNGDYAENVRAEEQTYLGMGIHSVPATIFNDRYLVSGGQSVEVFEQAIRQILTETVA